MVFDLELGAKLIHHFIIQVQGIVGDDLSWEPISAYDFFFYKSVDYSFRHISVRRCLYPFCVINCY